MLRWQRPDLIQQLSPNVDIDEVQKIRTERDKKLDIPYFKEQASTLEPLPTRDDLTGPLHIDLESAHVTIGKRDDLTDEQFALLEKAILRLQPWRKGPFRLFGYEINSEWQSNLKWDRIVPALGELHGRKILDVGCGNGYYMFRAAAGNPHSILGIDPSVPFYFSFELMQRFLQLENLQYERLGCEHLHVFDGVFDIALCMGIVYHHRNPINILRDLHKTLRVGGHAIIESQTIDGEGSMALFPEDRYAKARNVYFMPTRDCLINWVRRSGFKDVELVSHEKVTVDEQRSTELMAYESLADFLDPNDSNLTIEGYPAPYRTVVVGHRKFV